jgi:hypothetical protein
LSTTSFGRERLTEELWMKGGPRLG